MCKRTMYKRARIPMFLWERRACANCGAQVVSRSHILSNGRGSVTGKMVPEKMVLGPKFSLKILVPPDRFVRKKWSALKILVLQRQRELPIYCSGACVFPRTLIKDTEAKKGRLQEAYNM